MAIQILTPEMLCDLYWHLEEAKKGDFLELLGDSLTAEAMNLLFHYMEVSERKRFSDTAFNGVKLTLSYVVLDRLIDLVRDSPAATRDELKEKVRKEIQEFLGKYQNAERDIHGLEAAKLKQTRDRKSAPKTIRRNAELCEKRRTDPKMWSLKKLAKAYKITTRDVTKILKEDEKWCHLAQNLPSEPK